eukprot:TRINITY_DN14878_c0_g1_i2.p1 TRINITY_DN14878_c0_g1~~TRINITY_DN14878_c0_g1_i2.p1  ORF type:complete len:690 (-),score=148.29 TRINITY_DN14878_c0_g1_i2:230-2299(-)
MCIRDSLGPRHCAPQLERDANDHDLKEAASLWQDLFNGLIEKVPAHTSGLVSVEALKLYLHQLEDPIIPSSLTAAYTRVVKLADEELRLNTLYGLLSVLSRASHQVLQILIPHMYQWMVYFTENHISLDPIWNTFVPLIFGACFVEQEMHDGRVTLLEMVVNRVRLCLFPIGEDDSGYLSGPESPLSTPINPIRDAEASFKSQPRVQLKKGVRRKKYKVKKGKVIISGNPSFQIMTDLKLGLKVATLTCHEARKNQITLADFSVKHTEMFPAAGTISTPPHDSQDFGFKDYCPNVFRQIREQYDITVDDYIGSISDPNAPLRELGSPGKSGAVFYFSHDMKYLIKSVSKKESKFLRRILPYYYEHVMRHPDTTITLFYGLYCVKPHNMKPIRLVVMSNMFDMVVHEVYDIKGSTHGRITQDSNKKVEGVVLKDLDLGFQVHASLDKTEQIVDQLQIDVQFLESMSIMDYSLLLGVHYLTSDQYEIGPDGLPRIHPVNNAKSPNPNMLQRKSSVFQTDYGGVIALKSSGEVVILSFGVIDILQTYDNFKFSEHWCKRLCISKEAISVNDPFFYAKRFKERMKALFVYTETVPEIRDRERVPGSADREVLIGRSPSPNTMVRFGDAHSAHVRNRSFSDPAQCVVMDSPQRPRSSSVEESKSQSWFSGAVSTEIGQRDSERTMIDETDLNVL